MKVTYKRNFGNYERFGEDVESEDAVSNECFRSDEQDVVVTKINNFLSLHNFHFAHLIYFNFDIGITIKNVSCDKPI